MRFGDITINSDRFGTTLTHHAERRSLYFQPGDEAGDLHDALEATEAALEASGVTYTYADVLAAVWDDYRDAGQEVEA
jgi:hypothetical protein